MRKRWTTGVGVIAAFMAFVIGGLALADDESDRSSLIRSIDEKIKAIADKLYGFESDSSGSDVDDALYAARELKDLVSKLERVKGDHSRASSIVSYYPGYVDTFNEAAKYLKRMKEQQRLGDGVADRCKTDESTLQSAIRTYVGKPDDAEDAFSSLPAMAKSYGRTWSEMMAKLKDGDKELQNALSYARFSPSDNNWSYVASNLNGASAAMATYWNERYKAANDVCTKLALGEKHPDLEKALQELGKYSGNVKGTVTQLKKDYNEWLREVRKLRKFTDDDRDAIRDAICSSGEYEMEAKVNAVADRWASQISGVYGTIVGLSDRLKNRASASQLAKYKGPKQVIAEIDKNLTNLEKLKRYELLGSNNPKLRAKMEWGKKRHIDLQRACRISEMDVSSSYCDNRVRPGSGCRLDCLNVGSTCKIIEFKPDSTVGKSEGAVQIAAYRAGIEKWYSRDKAELLKAFPDIAACENRDKSGLNLDAEVLTYELCTSTVRNDLGEILDETTLDVVESGE
jgi:hypothetical protein